MLSIVVFVSIFIWLIIAAMLAAMLGAMFAPDKNKIVVRSILSILLLAPTILIVPLSFAAFTLFVIIIFIASVTIYGIRIVVELIKDGIPELDEEGNEIKKDTTLSPPWI